MSKKDNSNLPVLSTGVALPDHLQGRVVTGKGSEHVDANSMTVPRLKLAQRSSDEATGGHELEIPNLRPGDWFNSLTKEIYGPEVVITSCYFKPEWLVFRKRVEGGGLIDVCDTLAEAEAVYGSLDDPEKHEIQDTHQHYCMVYGDQGGQEIVWSAKSTAQKSSRDLNAMCESQKAVVDRYNLKFSLKSRLDKSKRTGDAYHNVDSALIDYVDEATSVRAEKFTNLVLKGEKVVERDTTGCGVKGSEF